MIRRGANKATVMSHSLPTRILQLVTTERLTSPKIEQGAIVWVEPIAEATPEDVELTKRKVLEAGAVHVLVLPRRTADAAVPNSVHDQATVFRANAREVVAELVARVNEEDREGVGAVVEGCMARAGL